MADAPNLSKEAFLQMAALHGLDTTDDGHMDELLGHVREILVTIAELRKLDLGDTEPANTFSPSAR